MSLIGRVKLAIKRLRCHHEYGNVSSTVYAEEDGRYVHVYSADCVKCGKHIVYVDTGHRGDYR